MKDYYIEIDDEYSTGHKPIYFILVLVITALIIFSSLSVYNAKVLERKVETLHSQMEDITEVSTQLTVDVVQNDVRVDKDNQLITDAFDKVQKKFNGLQKEMDLNKQDSADLLKKTQTDIYTQIKEDRDKEYQWIEINNKPADTSSIEKMIKEGFEQLHFESAETFKQVDAELSQIELNNISGTGICHPSVWQPNSCSVQQPITTFNNYNTFGNNLEINCKEKSLFKIKFGTSCEIKVK